MKRPTDAVGRDVMRHQFLPEVERKSSIDDGEYYRAQGMAIQIGQEKIRRGLHEHFAPQSSVPLSSDSANHVPRLSSVQTAG